MYTFDRRVRYSEIDHHGTMKLPALINYFQDCSTFQSEDIGQGLEVLKRESGRGFCVTGRWRSEDIRSWRTDHHRDLCFRIRQVFWISLLCDDG